MALKLAFSDARLGMLTAGIVLCVLIASMTLSVQQQKLSRHAKVYTFDLTTVASGLKYRLQHHYKIFRSLQNLSRTLKEAEIMCLQHLELFLKFIEPQHTHKDGII